ncbi:MAG: hypothetical protein PHD51_04220 [Patescibacteria group bacterium]|nr:hypothetical protein [Patescibacteria group bacterium]MDD5490830.1 hypothetical protein [Patescibacteria group bacterium]
MFCSSPAVFADDNVGQSEPNPDMQTNFKDATDILGSAAEKAGLRTGDSLESKIAGAIVGLLSVIGVVFLVLMVYGGVKWMTARGESEIIDKSKGIIRNAVTGLIVIFLAYAIVWTVSTFLFST